MINATGKLLCIKPLWIFCVELLEYLSLLKKLELVIKHLWAVTSGGGLQRKVICG